MSFSLSLHYDKNVSWTYYPTNYQQFLTSLLLVFNNIVLVRFLQFLVPALQRIPN
jgi:hypothetical protein